MIYCFSWVYQLVEQFHWFHQGSLIWLHLVGGVHWALFLSLPVIFNLKYGGVVKIPWRRDRLLGLPWWLKW